MLSVLYPLDIKRLPQKFETLVTLSNFSCDIIHFTYYNNELPHFQVHTGVMAHYTTTYRLPTDHVFF